MFEFLEQIEEGELWEFISRVMKFPNREKLLELDREVLNNVLFALYGHDVLYEKKIRKLLFSSLPEQELRQLAKHSGIKPSQKPYDILIGLSSLPWRVNSSIVWSLAEKFNIPLEFLPIKSKRCDPIEVIEPFTPLPKLFDYQKELVQKIQSFLTEGKAKCCLIQLPTGAGKTRTTVEALIQFCNSSESNNGSCGLLWLAHTEELCEQAIDSFKRLWQIKGEYENTLVRLWGDYKIFIKEILGGIVICGYTKFLILNKNEPELFEQLLNHTRVLIIDEAHKALAPKINEAIMNIKNKRDIKIIGLTATPGRSSENKRDNKNLALLFDKNLITPSSISDDAFNFLQKSGVISNINHSVLSTGIRIDIDQNDKNTQYFDIDIRPKILKILANNKSRNDLIIKTVVEEIRKNHPVLIFACSIDHAKYLAARVSFEGHNSTSVDYRMRSTLRQRVISDFKEGKIGALFNYGVLSTGFDAPNIKAIIIARPTTSIVLYSQMVGRGLRGALMGGTSECNLIDIKDNYQNFGPVEDVYNYFKDFWN